MIFILETTILAIFICLQHFCLYCYHAYFKSISIQKKNILSYINSQFVKLLSFTNILVRYGKVKQYKLSLLFQFSLVMCVSYSWEMVPLVAKVACIGVGSCLRSLHLLQILINMFRLLAIFKVLLGYIILLVHYTAKYIFLL